MKYKSEENVIYRFGEKCRVVFDCRGSFKFFLRLLGKRRENWLGDLNYENMNLIWEIYIKIIYIMSLYS